MLYSNGCLEMQSTLKVVINSIFKMILLTNRPLV